MGHHTTTTQVVQGRVFDIFVIAGMLTAVLAEEKEVAMGNKFEGITFVRESDVRSFCGPSRFNWPTESKKIRLYAYLDPVMRQLEKALKRVEGGVRKKVLRVVREACEVAQPDNCYVVVYYEDWCLWNRNYLITFRPLSAGMFEHEPYVLAMIRDNHVFGLAQVDRTAAAAGGDDVESAEFGDDDRGD